jgi:hypothetical protein
MVQYLGSSDFVFFSVTSVLVKAVDNELSLSGLEEFMGLCWEVNNDEPPEQADCDRYGALDDENPYSALVRFW